MKTLERLEPATFRFVDERVNHQATVADARNIEQ